MKTQTFLLGLLLLFFTGCSKDDENRQEEEATKLLTRVESDFLNVDVEYNDNHSVQKISIEDIIINFQYSNGNISTLQVQYNGPNSEANTYLFGYDENGKINEMTDDDLEVYEVTFDEAENTYQYNFDEDEVVTVQLTTDDEIAKFTRIRPNYETISEYFYNEENKGPMENTNPVAPHILLAVPDALIAYIVTAITKKSLERYEEGDETINFENVFDDGDYLISRDYMDFGGDPATDFFEYTEF